VHSEVVLPPYRILASPAGLPELYDHYRKHAVLVDEIDLDSSEGTPCFFAVGRGDALSLVVAQRYGPAGYGFYPGLLLVPETGIVFIGAGGRILAYSLEPEPRRLWVDSADCGFWSWSRHGDLVVMSAELELAAWTIAGEKRWTMFVEPPWSYTVSEGTLELDVMGSISTFPVATGPR